jgi:hypothetical protein
MSGSLRCRLSTAHHEPLLGVNLPARLGDIVDLAKLINNDLGVYIDNTTQIRQVVADRP